RIFLRALSTDTLQLRPELWSASAFLDKTRRHNLVTGLYYGALLSLLLYNLFLYFSTRDGAYLSYVAFQATLCLLQASFDQLTFQYLWPDHPDFATQSEPLLAGLMLFFGVQFADRYLELSTRLKQGRRWTWGLQAVALVNAGVSLLT